MYWELVDVYGKFSFRKPPGMIQEDVRGYDSIVGEYNGKDIHITFDYGEHSDSLSDIDDGSKLDYLESRKNIGGFNAKIIEYKVIQEDTQSDYIVRVHLSNTGDGPNKLTFNVYINSKNQEIALAIIESIQFQ